MSKQVEVILVKHVKGLGRLGETKRVKLGYARNFLIPQEMALPVNKDSQFRFKSLKIKEEKRLAESKSDADAIAKVIHGKDLLFEVSTHDDGKLYGSVSPADISQEIHTQYNITIDKKLLQRQHAIKDAGDYEIAIELHPDVQTVLNVKVVSIQQLEKEEEAKKEKNRKQKEDAEEEVEKAKTETETEEAVDTEESTKETAEASDAEDETKAEDG